MAIPIEIFGTTDKAAKVIASMHKGTLPPPGLVVYTSPFLEREYAEVKLINSEVGEDMNVNASFGGTPEIINVGTSDGVYWTGSNAVGTKGNFNSADRSFAGTVSVLWDNPNTSDIIQFTDTGTTTVTDYVAVTMQVNIDKDWNAGDIITFFCYDTGGAAIIGATIDLADYINVSSFDNWQKATIPFIDLGLSTVDFDAVRFQCTNKQGKAPKFYIDNLQLEQNGQTREFQTDLGTGNIFFVDSLVITIADGFAGTVADGTMPGLSYNAFLGNAELAGGIVFKCVNHGSTKLSAIYKNLGDFLTDGFRIIENISDGTNSFIVLEQKYSVPLELTGGDGSYMSLTVSDDLSGLLQLKATTKGSLSK